MNTFLTKQNIFKALLPLASMALFIPALPVSAQSYQNSSWSTTNTNGWSSVSSMSYSSTPTTYSSSYKVAYPQYTFPSFQLPSFTNSCPAWPTCMSIRSVGNCTCSPPHAPQTVAPQPSFGGPYVPYNPCATIRALPGHPCTPRPYTTPIINTPIRSCPAWPTCMRVDSYSGCRCVNPNIQTPKMYSYPEPRVNAVPQPSVKRWY